MPDVDRPRPDRRVGLGEAVELGQNERLAVGLPASRCTSGRRQAASSLRQLGRSGLDARAVARAW